MAASVVEEVLGKALRAETVAFAGFTVDLGALNAGDLFVDWLQEEVLLAFRAETEVTALTVLSLAGGTRIISQCVALDTVCTIGGREAG